MILDAQLLFSDAQAITAAADATNYIDLGVAKDIGVGQDLWVFTSVDVAMTDAGSNSTLSVSAIWDSTTTFTPDASQLLYIIPAVSAIGAIFFGHVNPQVSTLYRYMSLTYSPNNGDLSTGTFTSGIVLDIQKNIAYANAITIS